MSRAVLSTLLLVAAIPFPVSAQSRFASFDSWFEKYRAGRMLYPTAGSHGSEKGNPGAETDTLGSKGKLGQALQELLDSGSRPAAERLLQLAAFRFHADPREEKESHTLQQPWTVRSLAVETLGKFRDPETLRWITTEVLLGKTRRSPVERAAAARAIGLSGHQASLLGLLSALYDESWEVRAAAADAAGRFGGVQASMAIAQRLEDGEAAVRTRCIQALSAAFDPRDSRFTDVDRSRIVGAMIAKLSDPDWRVRAAACDFFSSHPAKESVPALVRALQEEKKGLATGQGRKRVFYQLVDALSRVGENAKLDVSTGAAPSYFGIPVRSDQILFLLDVSGSMQDAFEPAVATGASAVPSLTGRMSKIEWAKQELIATLSRLDASDHFNVIFFETSVYPVFDGTVPATAENVATAIHRIRAIAGGGGTNLFGALEIGLRIGAPNSPTPFETDADTVFLLSDGSPSTGPVTDIQAIAGAVEAANRSSRIAIHTIYFGGESGSEQLMEELARRNFGEIRRIAGR